MIALESLLDHPHFPNMRGEFLFLVTEPDQYRRRALDERLKALAQARGGTTCSSLHPHDFPHRCMQLGRRSSRRDGWSADVVYRPSNM